MSLRSKCDRAIVAYLRGKGVCDNIYPANFSGERTLPNVTPLCHSGRPEVDMQGNYRFQVRIRCEGHAAQQPEEINPEAQRVELDELTEAVDQAMMQSGNDEDLKAMCGLITKAGRDLAGPSDGTPAGDFRAKNNADMKDFTVTGFYDAGLDGGNPKNSDGAVEGSYWVEDLLFQMVACGLNVD